MEKTMDFRLERGFTLEEAINMVYSDELDVDRIYVEPPESQILTDEESGPEDDDVGKDINRLPGRLLSAAAEIIFADGTRKDVQDRPNEEHERGPNIPESEKESEPSTSQNATKVKSKKKVIPRIFKWAEGDLCSSNATLFPTSNYNSYYQKTPVQLFELFFNENVLKLILEQSKKYALFKNYGDPKITEQELKCFIGVLILSGYNDLPGKRFFWDSKNDMNNQLVSKSIRRNRFLQIMQFIHFSDNNNPNHTDKMWKLRPLINEIKKNLMSHFVPEAELDYDESMIRYYGRHSCKQYIRGKPIRFGFKAWCLNAKSGYLLNFDIYQGKDVFGTENDERYGKCVSSLVKMLQEFSDEKKTLPYNFFLDNLFTDVGLFEHLKENGYGVTGTFRANKIPNSCPLPSKTEFSKEHQRGDFVSILEKNSGTLFVHWLDNKTVTIGSTSYGVNPVGQAKRYSKTKKEFINIPRPHLISQYNNAMGGTDLMDHNISRYRTGVHSKKWWWCIFTWIIDVSIQNSWIIYRKTGEKITQLEFKREIATAYLTLYGVPPKGPGRTSTSKSSVTGNRVSDDIRYSESRHLLVPVPHNKRRRCAGEGCSTVGRTMCETCNVGLCVQCNYMFHTK